jgi:hypothetical protein
VKFAQTIASEVGFRDPAHNARRLNLLARLLERVAADGVNLVALPAGYVTVPTEPDVVVGAAGVADLAERTGVAVVGGVDVDVETRKDSRDTDALVLAGRLPYFGFAAFPTARDPEVRIWRQSSITSHDADTAPEGTLPGGNRVVTVAGRTLAVLLCGELFSRRAREAIAAAHPQLILDLAHARIGQGLIPAMTNLANLAGCRVAHSQHLAGWDGRSLHSVSAEGEQESVPASDSPYLEDDDFWIGWCIRTV